MKMKFYKYKILLLIFQLVAPCLIPGSIAQEKNIKFDLKDVYKLTYHDFQELELQAMESEDWEALSQITNYHLSKAKAEKNNIEIARGYYYKTILEESGIGLKYADSLIEITKGNSHPNYPTLGYSLKGHLYFNSGDFTSALENYLLAYNLALEKNNVEHQRENSLAIAAIRNINGQHYAAAELYKRSLHLLRTKPDYIKQHYEEYLTLLYNLSISHLRLQEVDSAQIFALKGIEQTVAHNDSENYRDFILLDAQINYYQNDYGKAKDTLLKYLDDLNGTNKAIKLYYLGKIEEKFNNTDLANEYFEEIDSIISITNDPFTELKDVYQLLIMHSINENDKRKQVEYIGKLIHYDSILSSGKEEVINKTMASYDIPFLKHQKKQAEEQLETKERLVMLAGFLAGLGSLSGLYFYTRSRRMREKLEVLLKEGVDGTKPKINLVEKRISHPASVPEDIRNDLLMKLERFEESERFLCKDLDMSTLADELGTNTSYLSVIINHYKEMNFPNYLKDLKIAAAIKGLNNDPQLLKYNYQGLADTFGFKTGESFSKAFYSKTGVYPSKFLNELKSRKTKGDL